MAGETQRSEGLRNAFRGEVFSHFQGQKLLGSGKGWENISPNGKVTSVDFSAWRHRKVFFFAGASNGLPYIGVRVKISIGREEMKS